MADKEKTTTLLERQLAELPAGPGVYLMKDARNEVLYVGKAKSLRARVRSYFQDRMKEERPFVSHMVPRIVRVDHVVTGNEKEALILENNLIKQFKPRFNINLKDDKTYVSIKIDLNHEFPRPVVTRQRDNDRNVLLFGPYSSASSVRSTLRYLNRLFPIRECSDYVLAHRSRPCPLYEMGRCAAPCVDKIAAGPYRELIDEIVLVLKGQNEALLERLNDKMLKAAEGLKFEEAARYRDQLQAIQHTAERQRIDSGDFLDRDVFAYHHQGEFMEVQAMFVRRGRLEDLANYSFRVQDRSPEEVFQSFLKLFYSQTRAVPEEVLVPVEVEDAPALSELLTEQRGKKVRVTYPRRGKKARLVELARINAENAYKTRHGKAEANRQILQSLKDDLQLECVPSRIECFDISNISGTLAVGSMVTFTDCTPDKKKYRHYRIQTVDQPDDFGMMKEMLRRRYSRALAEDDLPDLAIIDGGKGQLSAALEVFQELGVQGVDLVALAKSRRRSGAAGHTLITDERVFKPDLPEPIVIPQDSPPLLYLTRIRDEAHRFAVTYHRKLRQQIYRQGGLTSIPGVGEVLRKRLIKQFGSARGVRQATIEEIAQVQGISQNLARKIYDHFHA